MNNYPRELFNYKSANDIFYENLKLLLKMLQSFLDFTDYLGILFLLVIFFFLVLNTYGTVRLMG